MLFQLSTGSVSDQADHEIHVSARNAGIQPANVFMAVTIDSEDKPDMIVERTVKVAPREEQSIFGKSDDSRVKEVVIQIDSPSLILSIQSEYPYPILFRVELLDTWSWHRNGSNEPEAIPLVWGYFTKGAPF